MKTISDLNSPTKRLLNFQEYTPAKVMVGCQINSWLETHRKSPVIQPKRKPSKFIHTRINVGDKRSKQNISPFTKPIYPSNQSSGTAELLSITKLKIQIDALSTKCKTTQIGNNSETNKTSKEILDVDVSAFDEENKENNQLPEEIAFKKQTNPIDQFFNIYEVQLEKEQPKMNGGSMTDRLEERKVRISKILSYNKIRNASKPPIQGTDFSRKLTLINKSQEIVKGKLTTNQQRALNQIVKRSEFNLISCFGQDKFLNNSKPPLNLSRYSNKISSFRFFCNEESKK